MNNKNPCHILSNIDIIYLGKGCESVAFRSLRKRFRNVFRGCVRLKVVLEL